MPIRRRLTITGVVQGVGFRPFVWRRARELGLAGWVKNCPEGVSVELQGTLEAVDRFVAGLTADAPPLAAIDAVTVVAVPVEPVPAPFAIAASTVADRSVMSLPADIATCEACLAEVRSPANRRHRYAFTNCTDCGPRYTIIDALPYDRPATAMRGFRMCSRCAAEYADPGDRRFHAQPNACPDCGPTVWWTRAADRGGCITERQRASCVGEHGLAVARAVVRAGGVVAVKGLGGFHLLCDATNTVAIDRLRTRKGRAFKPFAVLVADEAVARQIAQVGSGESRLLTGRDRPIVLVRRRSGAQVADGVAPGNGFLGVMLPSTPLHHLLCASLPPLVMTSGNLAEEPIAIDNEEAARRLAPLVDGFLMHDRPIRAACDDSVVRHAAGGAVPLRRSRGLAPAAFSLPCTGPAVLAVGADVKVALCAAHGNRAWLGPHVGDMGCPAALRAAAAAAERLLRLSGVEPEAIVADLHPGYLSVQWARELSAARGVPLVQVQHHEAHVAALLTEHGGRERAIGVCLDGTGFGHDGTIWGGEFLVTDGRMFRRAAHLEPWHLPGGDACVRHPWRTALAALHAAGCPWDRRLAPVQAAGPTGAGVIGRQLDTRLQCVATSSMGRLFDAVAALAGLSQSVTYEAEAALALESLAARHESFTGSYAYSIQADLDGRDALGCETLVVRWHDLVRSVAADAVAERPGREIAFDFHQATATMIVAVCRRLRESGGGETVGLTGGVFQNVVLLELAAAGLAAEGFEVLVPRRVPPNDGGIALGQVVRARAILSQSPARGDRG
jgi:hydrogenase maturation protein HypF